MGHAKKVHSQPIPPVVTPAIAKTIDADADQAINNMQEARSRLRGIRSTYSRFAEAADTGTKSKLG